MSLARLNRKLYGKRKKARDSMSGSQVYDQRTADKARAYEAFDKVWNNRTGKETPEELADAMDAAAKAALCHCGKDGHPLGSVNCPVHGAKNRRDAGDAIASVVFTEAFAGAHLRVKAVPGEPPTTYTLTVSNYTKFDLDEDADAYEAAAREEFEPRPIAGCYDYEAISNRLAELSFNEREITAASVEDVDRARRWMSRGHHWRPNDATYNFDAIRSHLNVMRGDDINGTCYVHTGYKYTKHGQLEGWYEREHDFDLLTDRCNVCSWPRFWVEDNLAPRFCDGRPLKGEPCIQCGKPLVVTLPTCKTAGIVNRSTVCVACGYGVIYRPDQPIPDRGAVRFEQRMKGHYAKACAAHQALIDSAHMDNGPVRTPCDHRANHNDCPHCNDAVVAARIIKERVEEGRRKYAAELASMCGRGIKAKHPEGCVCDICIPF